MNDNAEIPEPAAVGDIESGCGYEWDHTIIELGDGAWECSECGAEGWAEDKDGRASS